MIDLNRPEDSIATLIQLNTFLLMKLVEREILTAAEAREIFAAATLDMPDEFQPGILPQWQMAKDALEDDWHPTTPPQS